MLGHVLYSIPETDNEGIPDDGKFISLRLKRARKSTINVKMYGEVPVITVKIFLEGDILSIDGDKNYFEGEELKELEKYAGEYMRNELVNFLEKTRSEFKSDICGTGRTLKRTFLFWDEWLAFRWSDKYEKAEFEVSAKVSVRRTGMTIKQVPAANMKGE
jgi:spore germination protein KC